MALSTEERAALFAQAFALLDRINVLLEEIFDNSSAKVKYLKDNSGNLSEKDRALLDAQLAYEAKMAA